MGTNWKAIWSAVKISITKLGRDRGAWPCGRFVREELNAKGSAGEVELTCLCLALCEGKDITGLVHSWSA